MTWTLIIAGVVGVLVAGWLALRRQVCLRRKDCCGKGCGCLFPRAPKE